MTGRLTKKVVESSSEFFFDNVGVRPLDAAPGGHTRFDCVDSLNKALSLSKQAENQVDTMIFV